MASLLSVKDLQVKFSTRKSFVTAVDNFSLNIDPGECVGLVGESGCGKTTTGLAIMRLLPGNGHIASGTVELEGRRPFDVEREGDAAPARSDGRPDSPGPHEFAEPDDEDRTSDR